MTGNGANPGVVVVMEMAGVAVSSLRVPGRVVLEGVDWEVRKGDFWAIGGLLGSGKSDFLFVAAGIMPPLRGVYRLFGQEFTGGFTQAQLAERLRLGFVFDGGQLLAHLTLAENISLPVHYHRGYRDGQDEEWIGALLGYAGLEGVEGHRPGEVGRQWRQRAGLARALALRPEILLLDDPLSGQDPRHLHWWLERLSELAAGHPITEGRPLTIVVTGMDLRPWRGVARQYGVLKNRRLLTTPPGQAAGEAVDLLHRELVGPEREGI